MSRGFRLPRWVSVILFGEHHQECQTAGILLTKAQRSKLCRLVLLSSLAHVCISYLILLIGLDSLALISPSQQPRLASEERGGLKYNVTYMSLSNGVEVKRNGSVFCVFFLKKTHQKCNKYLKSVIKTGSGILLLI